MGRHESVYQFVVTLRERDRTETFFPKAWRQRMAYKIRDLFDSYIADFSVEVDYIPPGRLDDLPTTTLGRPVDILNAGYGYPLYQTDMGGDYAESRKPERVKSPEDANLIGSGPTAVLDADKHMVCLDIDTLMFLRPSRTPGHVHLYFPHSRIIWHEYKKLLYLLAKAGILETGYVDASIDQGATYLRAWPTSSGFKDDKIPQSLKEKRENKL